MCDDKPSEATLQRERQLILSLDVARPIRADLLAVAVTVGTRFFARELLEAIFQEEMVMLKEASFITEWIEEGEARGEVRGKREALARLLVARFGPLPAAVEAALAEAGPERLEGWIERAATAPTLAQVGID